MYKHVECCQFRMRIANESNYALKILRRHGEIIDVKCGEAAYFEIYTNLQ